MSLTDITYKNGGTTSTTGGTDVTLRSLDNADGDNHRMLLEEGKVNVARRVITFSGTDAKPDSTKPSGYTQRRSKLYIDSPNELSSGEYNHDTVSINFGVSVETTEAETNELVDLVIQMLNSTEFRASLDSQSVE